MPALPGFIRGKRLRNNPKRSTYCLRNRHLRRWIKLIRCSPRTWRGQRLPRAQIRRPVRGHRRRGRRPTSRRNEDHRPHLTGAGFRAGRRGLPSQESRCVAGTKGA
ncbi:hypothetical protein RPHASCH2410_CH13300 [Rhizobium phaseoli Ch24-10]|nr:hypothetical protein RPHASCH2410_CH13300 [Rhizobium phaseoli Ch24-10]